jgi:large subunit ribosomal protein L40
MPTSAGQQTPARGPASWDAEEQDAFGIHSLTSMATVLFAAARGPCFSLRIAQTSVRHAGRKESSSADPIKETIRRTLYPPNIRNRVAPTGTWRPDVSQALQIAIPSRQAHDTIERAWKLHLRHLRKAREGELRRKYECMHRAMDELARIDPRLFREANRSVDPRDRKPGEAEWLKKLSLPQRRAYEARLPGLFPRELRAPADTPPRDGWKYDFKPIKLEPPKSS